MSEAKKAPQGKVKKMSKGERASGGRVPNMNCNGLEHALNQALTSRTLSHKVSAGFEKARALIRRAARRRESSRCSIPGPP